MAYVHYTHSHVILQVSPETYREIRGKLLAAGHGEALVEAAVFGGLPTIDMSGIALALEQDNPEPPIVLTSTASA